MSPDVPEHEAVQFQGMVEVEDLVQVLQTEVEKTTKIKERRKKCLRSDVTDPGRLLEGKSEYTRPLQACSSRGSPSTAW
jgi:hypothetical protein